MRNLGYAFWVRAKVNLGDWEKYTDKEKILDVVLFILFSGILVARYTWRPQSFKDTVLDFPGCSYLGAVPIVRRTGPRHLL